MSDSKVDADPKDQSMEIPFESFRDYLLLLARTQIGKKYLRKFDASDVVQQTLMTAHADRALFRGTTEREAVAWLRQILATKLAREMRDLGRGKRDLGRERAIHADLDASAAGLERMIVADQTSPSLCADRIETARRLAGALARLPEGQREAMILRHCHGMMLVDIARHLDCTPPTVVGLIQRGSRKVRELLRERDQPE